LFFRTATLRTVAINPDQFAYVGVWSMGVNQSLNIAIPNQPCQMNQVIKNEMRPIIKKIAILSAGMLTFVVLMAFPFGPLLPWSPIKPGYHRTTFASAEIYFNRNERAPEEYRELDQMAREAEAFHHLRFHQKVTVIACKNWGDCERGLPWLNVHPLGGVTLATGDVIYITPTLREKNFSLREFLRHELSHALISQNTTIRKSVKLNEVAWFNEGLAVSFARQHDYLSREAFLSRAATDELAKFIDPAKIDQSSPNWSARFAYPAQRYFVEYLKATFGDERFTQFLVKCIADPDNHSTLFSEVFQQPIADAIGNYQKAVRTGQRPLVE